MRARASSLLFPAFTPLPISHHTKPYPTKPNQTFAPLPSLPSCRSIPRRNGTRRHASGRGGLCGSGRGRPRSRHEPDGSQDGAGKRAYAVIEIDAGAFGQLANIIPAVMTHTQAPSLCLPSTPLLTSPHYLPYQHPILYRPTILTLLGKLLGCQHLQRGQSTEQWLVGGQQWAGFLGPL